ncbi:hypothetical protein M408DRAFT_321969 [Serendipita vermifera MAFF 305830]|uniref:Uncharacterized protein n=1 Tax=Serendipita vermifera MAFF 305830 TaxID=933852 RepID=A0A0C2XPQ9_SERVB|nr:hypothetical protein M408DRAFT_321969 [Serendipita vermifera MAFF 305830]
MNPLSTSTSFIWMPRTEAVGCACVLTYGSPFLDNAFFEGRQAELVYLITNLFYHNLLDNFRAGRNMFARLFGARALMQLVTAITFLLHATIERERNIGAALEDGLRDRRGTDVIERTEYLCARKIREDARNENTATEKPSPSKGVAEDSFDRDRVAGLECREPSPRCSKGRPNKTVTRVPPQTCHSRTDAPVEPSMAGFVTPVGWPVGAIVMMPPKSFDPDMWNEIVANGGSKVGRNRETTGASGASGAATVERGTSSFDKCRSV